MPKAQRQIANENLFIPARSAICRAADTALIFGVVAAGLAAAIAVAFRQLAGAF